MAGNAQTRRREMMGFRLGERWKLKLNLCLGTTIPIPKKQKQDRPQGAYPQRRPASEQRGSIMLAQKLRECLPAEVIKHMRE
jgi:hypothetical protein